jgi:hypothetical protein
MFTNKTNINPTTYSNFLSDNFCVSLVRVTLNLFTALVRIRHV